MVKGDFDLKLLGKCVKILYFLHLHHTILTVCLAHKGLVSPKKGNQYQTIYVILYSDREGTCIICMYHKWKTEIRKLAVLHDDMRL